MIHGGLTTILLATGNSHKSEEMRQILSPLLPKEINLVDTRDLGLPQPPDEIECYETFEENALAKARWYADKSGFACIADDSGICVDALNGAPGVRSARWAGPDATDADRCHLLLGDLQKSDALGSDRRGAHFVCACVFARPNRSEILLSIGRVYGEILLSQLGESGFGYDPIFYLPELKQTMAQISQPVKNTISHRAIALQGLATKIQADMQ